MAYLYRHCAIYGDDLSRHVAHDVGLHIDARAGTSGHCFAGTRDQPPLLGYGARAVNPYLAQECIAELIDKGLLDKDYHTAIKDYNSAIHHGIVKIASKRAINSAYDEMKSSIKGYSVVSAYNNSLKSQEIQP